VQADSLPDAAHTIDLKFNLALLLTRQIIAFVESVNLAALVNQLLLARKKRMTLRADFHPDDVGLFGGARFKGFAAGAMDCYLLVVGVYFFFHFISKAP
jgi:hypothetical protein